LLRQKLRSHRRHSPFWLASLASGERGCQRVLQGSPRLGWVEHGRVCTLYGIHWASRRLYESVKELRRDRARPRRSADGLRLARSACAGGRAAVASRDRWTSRHFHCSAGVSRAGASNPVAGEARIPNAAVPPWLAFRCLSACTSSSPISFCSGKGFLPCGMLPLR